MARGRGVLVGLLFPFQEEQSLKKAVRAGRYEAVKKLTGGLTLPVSC